MAVAAGTIMGPSGTPMAGSPVELYAWPSSTVLKAMKAGQLVPRTLLTTATTNSSGQYTLMVPAAKLKATVVDNGYANLEIDNASGIWFLTYRPGAVPAPATVTVNMNAKKAKWPCGYAPAGPPFYGEKYGFYGWSLLRKSPRGLKPAKAVVGQGYIDPSKRTAGYWVNFQYTKGSSHSQSSTLGVALSGYGIDAGYSDTGTDTSTAKNSEGWPNYYRNTLYWTEFDLGQYRGLCISPLVKVKVPHQKQAGACPKSFKQKDTGWTIYVHKCLWQVKAIGWFAGATKTHPTKNQAAPGYNCAPQAAGTHFNTDYGAAIEWASKFEIGAAIGIKGVNLKASFGGSAQTGYDSNAILYYQFGKKSGHSGWICGTNAQPSSAAILVARGRQG